jgi:membrane protease YdiL (CAAX protease family)
VALRCSVHATGAWRSVRRCARTNLRRETPRIPRFAATSILSEISPESGQRPRSGRTPDRVLTLLLFTLVVITVAVAMARLHLESGSMWPPIVLHGVWNEALSVFDGATPTESLWLGEYARFGALS